MYRVSRLGSNVAFRNVRITTRGGGADGASEVVPPIVGPGPSTRNWYPQLAERTNDKPTNERIHCVVMLQLRLAVCKIPLRRQTTKLMSFFSTYTIFLGSFP